MKSLPLGVVTTALQLLVLVFAACLRERWGIGVEDRVPSMSPFAKELVDFQG